MKQGVYIIYKLAFITSAFLAVLSLFIAVSQPARYNSAVSLNSICSAIIFSYLAYAFNSTKTPSTRWLPLSAAVVIVVRPTMLAVDTLVFAPWWKVDDFARVMSIATMGISAFIVIAAALKLKPLKNR
jgi:hypothetical protein